MATRLPSTEQMRQRCNSEHFRILASIRTDGTLLRCISNDDYRGQRTASATLFRWRAIENGPAQRDEDGRVFYVRRLTDRGEALWARLRGAPAA